MVQSGANSPLRRQGKVPWAYEEKRAYKGQKGVKKISKSAYGL
jgi:hypothetical protein